jgi:hypothetical protein
MCIEALDEALNGLAVRPKGIQVGNELWKGLESAGRISRKSVIIKECNMIWDGIKLPFLDDNIYVEACPSLGPCEYAFPP